MMMAARRLAAHIALSVIGTAAALTPSAVIVYSIKHARDESAHAARAVERIQRTVSAESRSVRVEAMRLRVEAMRLRAQLDALRDDMEDNR